MASSSKRHEKRLQVAEMRGYIAQGMGDSEVAEETGWDLDLIRELRKRVVESELIEVRRANTDQVFAEYRLRQHKNIRDLNEVVKKGLSTAGAQATVLVGAIRARSDIEENILNRAEQFGIIPKEVLRREMTEGEDLTEMDMDELRQRYADELQNLELLRQAYPAQSMDKDVDEPTAEPGMATAPTPKRRKIPT